MWKPSLSQNFARRKASFTQERKKAKANKIRQTIKKLKAKLTKLEKK
jgi:hypothetical protein